MILSCDPPRHAFLIHFGKRQRPSALEVVSAEYRGARVEAAIDGESLPPTLLAVHFMRHGFRLPFVPGGDGFAASNFFLQAGRRDRLYFFHFSFNPTDCQEWRALPGLSVLVDEPADLLHNEPGESERRPVLHGMVVDLDVLNVEVDASEFVFEFGADNLKDVPVTLFMGRPVA